MSLPVTGSMGRTAYKWAQGPVGGVAFGLITLGASAYAYLAVSGRALGAERFGALSVLWVLVYTIGPGLFVPLEQEIGRSIAVRRSRGTGALPVAYRGALVTGAYCVGVVSLLAVMAPTLVPALFRGDATLLWCTVLAVATTAIAYLSRGVLAGAGHFRRYGVQLAVEGVLRASLPALLLLGNVHALWPYALVLSIAGAVSVLVTTPRPGRLLEPGPSASAQELIRRTALLLGASLLANLIVNWAPLAVELTSNRSEKAAAGVLLAALVVARVPLFLFSAVQAVMLPRLAERVGKDDLPGFSARLRSSLLLVALLAIAGLMASALLGPWIVRTFFGPDFTASSAMMTLLALASGTYMLALAIAQSLIAMNAHKDILLGWAAGAAVLALFTSLVPDMHARAVGGFLAGGTVALAVLSHRLLVRYRQWVIRVRSE